MVKETKLEMAKVLIDNERVFLITDVPSNDHYIIEGDTGKYLVVLPGFCSCNNFTFTCLDVPKMVCKHILAASNSSKPLPIEKVDIVKYITKSKK